MNISPLFSVCLLATLIIVSTDTVAQPDKKGNDVVQAPEAPQPDGAANPQEPDNSEGETNAKTDDAAAASTGRFEKLINERIRNVSQIDKLYSTMPIGFANQQKKYTDAIEALKKRNLVILAEMKDAAVESFMAEPGKNQKVVNYLLQMTNRHLTGKDPIQFPFNPDRALELFNLVDGQKIEIQGREMYGYRANYLMEDYEEAKKFLDIAKDANPNIDIKVFDDLEKAIKAFERENEFRAKDKEANLPRVRIETDKGDIVIELFEDQAPNTVANFISLVEQGFYNGQSFHKVNSNLTAAAGCPYNNGTGGPGYEIKCECYDNDENIRHHFRGTVSMAHGGRDTGGSRFFITKQRIPTYDGKFTAFGRVIEGMENVYKLAVVDNTASLQQNAKPSTKMERVSVIRKRNHDYSPQKIANSPKIDPGTSDLLSDPLGNDKK